MSDASVLGGEGQAIAFAASVTYALPTGTIMKTRTTSRPRLELLEDRITPTSFTVREAVTVDLVTAVSAFQTDLGSLNSNTAGSVGSGRREINWDGVPDSKAAPNALPADFFNTTSPRGVVLSTPGSGFQVSANVGVAPVRFDNINTTYSTTFSAFSAQRLFTAIGSNVTDVTFFIPGSTTPASVTGFGAVFTDVDTAGSTKLEFFSNNNVLLFSQTVLATAGTLGRSFLGAKADTGTPIARVRITSGAAALGGDDVTLSGANDLVVMDDFIYGEPLTAPEGGSVGGIVFNDVNGDGVEQNTEPGLGNVKVFEDGNANGLLDGGEKNTTTAADGSWTLTFVADGARRIRAERPSQFVATTAVPTFLAIFGGSSDTLDFGFQDTTPPVVLSIARLDANPTAAAVVRFQVTFSDPVTGFDAADLVAMTASGGGFVAGDVVSITGSGALYTVTTTSPVGTGVATFTLQLSDNNSVLDANGTPLGGPTVGDGNFSGGEVYTIDRLEPTVTINQAAAQADPTGGTAVVFDVHFNEAVTGFTAADVSTAGSTVSGFVSVLGSGADYTVTVSGLSANGTVVATIPGGGATDVAGNANLASTSTDNSVTVVQTADLPPVNSPTGDLFAVATGPGLPVKVNVFETDGTLRFTLTPFDNFSGGATVATGDVTGDGIDDILVGAGAGAGPHVKLFDGATGTEIRSFFAFDPGFAGGLFVGLGDVTGDGLADLVIGAGAGAGPHVKVFDGATNAELRSFFAYDQGFTGGVSVRAGDTNADGFADIVTGAGPGGGPHIKVFSGKDGSELQSFFAGDPTFTGGVFVGIGDFKPANPLPEIVASSNGVVRVFSSAAAGLPYLEQENFTPFGPSIAAVPATIRLNDGTTAVLVGAAGKVTPHVQILGVAIDGIPIVVRNSFFAFDESFRGGVNVG